jgi:hypothetical protein
MQKDNRRGHKEIAKNPKGKAFAVLATSAVRLFIRASRDSVENPRERI